MDEVVEVKEPVKEPKCQLTKKVSGRRGGGWLRNLAMWGLFEG